MLPVMTATTKPQLYVLSIPPLREMLTAGNAKPAQNAPSIPTMMIHVPNVRNAFAVAFSFICESSFLYGLILILMHSFSKVNL